MLLAGIIFLVILPYLLLVLCPSLDERLGVDLLTPGKASILAGAILVEIGFAFGFWSIYLQLNQGRGTPLPVMPTQGLLTTGPYRFCRNPMTFGAVSVSLGMAIAAVTPTGVALVLSLASLLVIYLKRVEEKELAERFGQPYLEYKRTVPFLLPRWPKSG